MKLKYYRLINKMSRKASRIPHRTYGCLILLVGERQDNDSYHIPEAYHKFIYVHLN